MLSGVSSRKARGRADRFMSWKPLVQWPKANRVVIWSNTCLVTSSYQSERADSDIEHLCPLWWKLFPAAPVRCWEAKAAQGTSCFDLGSAPAAPVAAQLLSWFLLGLRCPWQRCRLGRDCWIFIPGNEVRHSRCTAGFSGPKLGLRRLRLGKWGSHLFMY